ncbi:MAG: DUF3047 domain-containing protein [Rubrivivax sp.]|nr:DUF3047 domain-containing protein [Rubrivivax sp.]
MRTQADGSGRWLEESRDVVADWRHALFGDEALSRRRWPRVIIAADADNTGATPSSPHVTGLMLEP